MNQFAVNRELFPIKAHFFFSAAGQAPVVPFLPIIAKQLGFSTVVVGIIYTILPFIALLMKPLSGIVSDKYQMHKSLFLAFQVLGIFALLGINYIEPLQHRAQLGLYATANGTPSAAGAAELRFCPGTGKLDSCAAGEILAYRPTPGDELMACELQCSGPRATTSGGGLICNANNTSSDHCAFDMRATVNLSRLAYEPIDGCLHMPLHEAFVGEAPVLAGWLASPAECSALCSDPNIMFRITDNRISDASVLGLGQFWTFFVCMIVSWTAMTVVGNLADTICFQILGDRPHLYGKQRLWAAVGWGLFSLLAGYMVDRMSSGQAVKDYSGVFAMMVVLMACDVLFSSRLKSIQTTRSASMLNELGSLMRTPAICVFLGVCVAVGMGTALIWNFLFWHLEELADGEKDQCSGAKEWMKTLQGLAMGVQCFGGELPFFFYSGALLKRIGHTHAMSLVLLTMSVRFLLYSVLANPWWVLPVELCQGITYGIFYSTMASYASKVAPPGMGSTVQGLVGAVHEGIGIAAGSLIGGFLMDRLGGTLTFRWYGAVGLVLCGLHVLAQSLMERFGTKRLDGQVDAGDGASAERGAVMVAKVAAERDEYRTITPMENDGDNTGGGANGQAGKKASS